MLYVTQNFLEDYPRHEKREDAERKINELREKLAEKQWKNAELYRKMMEYKSSLIYYDIVLEQYYDTGFADDALYGKALIFMDREEYQDAKEQLLLLKNKFPESDLLPAAERLLRQAISRGEDDETEIN